ncbi:hypothetical protein AAFC00_006018 [Neodothiora populina]|uniref:Small nuclear ribonucleoprotein Prp3 C-terminal domain-containing protein n=1 Tax=Neodothiora populina TaxID=2781224 RepID=A0ABR3P6P0_9PEZI
MQQQQQQQKIWFALPREIMELQLSMIDLLTAMFPEWHELDIDPLTVSLIEQLQAWCEDEKMTPSSGVPPSLSLALNQTIQNTGYTDQAAATTGHSIQLNITVPLQSEDPEPMDAPPLRITVRQPDWMSKAEVAELSTGLPNDDVFAAIEYIREQAPRYLTSYLSPAHSGASGRGNESRATDPTGPLTRVWFYFPSLSTREKRNDLVNNAPHYNLTGFVLAGKPGMLCLEGSSADIDAYMKFIKTESWGDIPSYQKKVSERYREQGTDVTRVFDGMQEITDSLGERRGERANRGDMKALEAWLVGMGLGEAFERVIM